VPKISQGKGKGNAKQTGAAMYAQMKKKQPEEESQEPEDPSGSGSFDVNDDNPEDNDDVYDRVAQLYLHEMPSNELHFPYMATQEMGCSIDVSQIIKGIDYGWDNESDYDSDVSNDEEEDGAECQRWTYFRSIFDSFETAMLCSPKHIFVQLKYLAREKEIPDANALQMHYPLLDVDLKNTLTFEGEAYHTNNEHLYTLHKEAMANGLGQPVMQKFHKTQRMVVDPFDLEVQG